MQSTSNDRQTSFATTTFASYLAPLRRAEWVVYGKRPFAGPTQVLRYLARYTHRVAIANSRLISFADGKVCFRWKDYRQEGQSKLMTLGAGEFIRRFLLHVLPDGFHRIRHYGLFANGHRAAQIAKCRELLADKQAAVSPEAPCSIEAAQTTVMKACPCCGGRMIIIETFDGPEMGPRSADHPRRLDGL